MQCPKCKITAAIRKTRYVTENDTTPEKETKLYLEQSFKCRNPQCSEYGKIIGTARHPLRLEKDEE